MHRNYEIPISDIMFFKSMYTVILLLPIMIYDKFQFLQYTKIVNNAKRDIPVVIVTYLWYKYAVQVYVNDATILSFMTPIFSVIMAQVFMREKVDLRIWIALFLCFIGAILCVEPHFNNFKIAYVMIILIASIRAIVNVASKILITKQDFKSILLNNALLWLIVTTIIAPPKELFYNLGIHCGFALIAILYILYLTFFYLGLHFSTISIVQPFDFFRLPASITLSYFAFQEVISFNGIVGSAVIIGSYGLLYRYYISK